MTRYHKLCWTLKAVLCIFLGYMVNDGLKTNTSWVKKRLEGNAFFVLFRLRVNLCENFISILGAVPSLNEFPTDANFWTDFFIFLLLRYWLKRMDLPFMSTEWCLETCHCFRACPAVESKEQFCKPFWPVLRVKSRPKNLGEQPLLWPTFFLQLTEIAQNTPYSEHKPADV